jgi:hypothetical protein
MRHYSSRCSMTGRCWYIHQFSRIYDLDAHIYILIPLARHCVISFRMPRWKWENEVLYNLPMRNWGVIRNNKTYSSFWQYKHFLRQFGSKGTNADPVSHPISIPCRLEGHYKPCLNWKYILILYGPPTLLTKHFLLSTYSLHPLTVWRTYKTSPRQNVSIQNVNAHNVSLKKVSLTKHLL